MAKLKNNTVALIGMTGCGKSCVGRILAKKLGAMFIDLDDEIIRRHGEIKKIFSEQGEEAFRKIEAETLRDITFGNGENITVLSCGGGLPTYEPSRKLLSEMCTVVWLRRNADSVLADKNVLERPPINGNPENYRKLLEVRYKVYRKMADYSFYNAFPQRTAATIVKKLELGKREN